MAEQESAKQTNPVNPAVQAAKDRQAIEEANLAILEARQKRIRAQLPALSGITGDTLAAAESGPQVGSIAAVTLALQDAARKVATRVAPQAGWRIYVTSEHDLAAIDAAYRSVSTGTIQLTALADHLVGSIAPVELPPIPPRTPEKPTEGAGKSATGDAAIDWSTIDRTILNIQQGGAFDMGRSVGTSAVLGAVGLGALAVAGPAAAIPFGLAAATGLIDALPSVISALSTQRTVNSQSNTISELTATLEVASQLLAVDATSQDPYILHSHFRFQEVPTSIDAAFTTLSEKRRALLALSLTISKTRALIEARIAFATATLAAIETELKSATAKQKPALLDYQLRISDYAALLTQRLAETALQEGQLESALEAIDTFVSLAQAAPAAGGRSAREAAALMATLRTAPGKTPWRILLVTPLPACAHISTEDGGFFRKDGFLTIGEAALSWALIELPSSHVQKSGTAVGKGHVYTNYDRPND